MSQSEPVDPSCLLVSSRAHFPAFGTRTREQPNEKSQLIHDQVVGRVTAGSNSSTSPRSRLSSARSITHQVKGHRTTGNPHGCKGRQRGILFDDNSLSRKLFNFGDDFCCAR